MHVVFLNRNHVHGTKSGTFSERSWHDECCPGLLFSSFLFLFTSLLSLIPFSLFFSFSSPSLPLLYFLLHFLTIERKSTLFQIAAYTYTIFHPNQTLLSLPCLISTSITLH